MFVYAQIFSLVKGDRVLGVWSRRFESLSVNLDDGGPVDALRERDAQLARGGRPLH